MHPWQKARIEQEKTLSREYGLKNKKEIHKHNTFLEKLIVHYKQLNYQTTEQATKEQQQIFEKAKRYGLLSPEKQLSAILNLKVVDVLERRLQTIVFRKKLARSMKQARQFITHQHIAVNGRVIDAPSYMVSVDEENALSFVGRSTLADEAHPERSTPVVEKPKTKAEEKKQEEQADEEIELPIEDEEEPKEVQA